MSAGPFSKGFGQAPSGGRREPQFGQCPGFLRFARFSCSFANSAKSFPSAVWAYSASCSGVGGSGCGIDLLGTGLSFARFKNRNTDLYFSQKKPHDGGAERVY